MLRMRSWMVGGTIGTLAFLTWMGASSAGDDEKAQHKQVLDIAAKFKASPEEGMKAAAAMSKKLDSLEYVMHGFKVRKKDGFGMGDVPGAITPDGIELYINGLQRDGITATALEKHGKAIEEMAYRTAAIAEIAKHFNSKDFKGKKTKKDWQDLSDKMRDGALKLAAATKAKGAAEIKSAAKMVNDSCNACHSLFRE